MFKNVNINIADSNIKLARPRQLPTCPNGHGFLVPAHALYGCIDCGHTQPRTPSTRTAPTEATDLPHHLRQADAPEDQNNEKGNNGPAGNSGDRGRAVPGGADSASSDEIDAWVRDSIAAERVAYHNRRWN